MLNLKTLYPYTNQSFDEINKKLADPEFEGIVLPVGLPREMRREVAVFRLEHFLNYHHFDFYSNCIGCIELVDFMKKVNLQNKKVFLSFIELFDNYCGGKSLFEKYNYQIIRKTISQINELTDNLVINNNFYHPQSSIWEFFVKLKTEFPNIEYVYTNYNKDDDISMMMDSIVVRNMGYDEIIKYINLGKKYIYQNL